ncbi:hypothetical protein SAMN05216200_102174 [Oceanicella actignis]|uniref:RNA polymerase sigma factor, sigma-70 family n=2 Tax=Oceanicella actignis TaxID=1189325 RepID=A0A1M7SB89_9RHOB|nr:hypothetical protein SAMN04488119_103334 [Oceanicella actignis]SHN55780.1 hypothetical protein SAMN05216200_102174 [Oceanicella actignis]
MTDEDGQNDKKGTRNAMTDASIPLQFVARGLDDARRAEAEAALRELAARRIAPLLAAAGWTHEPLRAVVTDEGKGAAPIEVRLHLHLPRRNVAEARATGRDLGSVVEQAVEHLRRRAQRALERLRGQESWRRRARRERLHALKARVAALPPEIAREAEAGLAGLDLSRLERIARRELAFMRAMGELEPAYPTLTDVIDETLAETRAAWTPGLKPEEVERALLRTLFKVLDREAENGRVFVDALSLQARPARDAEDQAEDMVQEEFHEFHQPDEDLSLADILPDPSAMSAEDAQIEAADAALERGGLVAAILRDLPALWRRALVLREIEGFDEPDLAHILDIPRQTAAAHVVHARAFVVARLTRAGLAGGDEIDLARLLAGGAAEERP